MSVSLARRFSLLRTPAGEPASLDDLRSKLAQQRFRGTDVAITEEEEDMLLETLGKLKGRLSGSHGAAKSDESFSASTSEVTTEESGSTSSATIRKAGTSSGNSSTSTARSKRYSNGLFGSGRSRENTYPRAIASAKPSEESEANTISFSDGQTSPIPKANTNAGASVSSFQSSNGNDQGSVLSMSSSIQETLSAAEYRLQKNLGPAGLKRASLALERAIKEMEDEEVEEEIVMPRSTPIPRNHTDAHSPHQGNGFQSSYLLPSPIDVSATLGPCYLSPNLLTHNSETATTPDGHQ